MKLLRWEKDDESLISSYIHERWNTDRTCFVDIPYKTTKQLLCISFQSDTRHNLLLWSLVAQIQQLKSISPERNYSSASTTHPPEPWIPPRHSGHVNVSPSLLSSPYCSMHFRQNVWKQGNIFGLVNTPVHIGHSVASLTSFSNRFILVDIASDTIYPKAKTNLNNWPHTKLYLNQNTHVLWD